MIYTKSNEEFKMFSDLLERKASELFLNGYSLDDLEAIHLTHDTPSTATATMLFTYDTDIPLKVTFTSNNNWEDSFSKGIPL